MLWTSDNKSDTKLIAIKDQIIYLGNPKPADLNNYIADFKFNNIPTKNVMGIPFSYINSIHLRERGNSIELRFGNDSTEEIMMSDANKKEEIFNYLKDNNPGLTYTVVAYSKLKAGKKPLIAMAVLLGIFTWSFYIAGEIEKGYMYDVEGGHYNSIAGLVLILAGLGTKKIALLFGTLFVVALLSLLKKIKNPPVIRILQK